MSNEAISGPRYVAVKLRKGSINLSAGIEDRVSGELIRVANASMATRLAEWLNDEAEGRTLPERGARHVPIRFQLAHDALPSPQTSVLYVHGNGVRLVASAPRDAVARHLQRLLARADYPVDEHGWLAPPKAHDFGDRLDSLPDQTLELPKPELRPYWRRIVGVTLWMWIPMIVLVILLGYALGWLIVADLVATWVAVCLLLPLALRQ